MVDAEV
jgi:hypothetical protein